MDSLEALFSTFTNEALLRAELRRLFRWLKDKKLTAVIIARGFTVRRDRVLILDQEA